MTIQTQINVEAARPLGRPGDLILDCDGVLLDWLAGFAAFIKHKTGRTLDPNGPSNFMFKDWLGVASDDEAYSFINHFNAGDHGDFENLPAIEGAKDVLHKVHAQRRGIHIITACSTDPAVIAMRKRNLRNVFGDIFSTIICTDLSESKSPHLAKFAPGIWVEDKFENAMAGAEEGHESYLIRTSHNRSHEMSGQSFPFKWVDGWSDLEIFI